MDEYTLGQTLGKDAALDMLRAHWDSWCTWTDFQRIQQAGFNLVRIPIGFWAYDTYGTPFVTGAADYVDAAIDWARSLGLKMIIDLHGAPGSQNGYDNSGERLQSPQWTQGDTVAQTLQVLETISNKYAQPNYQDVVLAIELLNEPLLSDLNFDTVRQFYRDGYGQVRAASDTPVVLHDGFKAPSSWNGFLTPSDGGDFNVAMDHHEYQVFSDDTVSLAPWQRRQLVCNNGASYSGADKWTFVGEWTAAMTDCALWLNGRGVGARFDGTFDSSPSSECSWYSDIASWPESYRKDTRGYIEAQLDAFEARTQGWIFWNFKTEGAGEWDLFRLLDAGVFPQPITDREFGPVCDNL